MNKEIDDKDQILRQITHQLISTLHGLQGYSENLSTLIREWEEEKPHYFSDWEKRDVQHLQNSTESIIWISRYAAKQVDNLSWITYEKPTQRKGTDLEIVQDVAEFLIKTARDYQGLARQRGLGRIRVDTESTAVLNNRLLVDPELFRQALSNLIDNAVKYSTKGADIVIEGKIVKDQAIITITNWGVQLHSDETNNIFRQFFRGKEAHRMYPLGTGIGLSVSQQILETFGGKITVQSSKQTSDGWKTTFAVSLPLYPTNDNR